MGSKRTNKNTTSLEQITKTGNLDANLINIWKSFQFYMTVPVDAELPEELLKNREVTPNEKI